MIRKNNLFDIFDFAENRKINLYAFINVYILHLLILEIISLNLVIFISS